MSAWENVSVCESGQQWHLESGDPPGPPGTGASAWGGGLQFQPASWNAAISYLRSLNIDTSHFGTHASNSTKQQQILAAEALLHIQPGRPDPWACDPNYTLGKSMFDGGANPWGLDGARIPTSVIDGSSGDAFPTDLSDVPGSTLPPVTPPTTQPPVSEPPSTPPTNIHTGHGSGRWWHHWTVAKGDCLWKVSVHAYGNGQSWNKIYKANPQLGDDPNLIHPGDYLYVP
jgi:hypothetical protein